MENKEPTNLKNDERDEHDEHDEHHGQSWGKTPNKYLKNSQELQMQVSQSGHLRLEEGRICFCLKQNRKKHIRFVGRQKILLWDAQKDDLLISQSQMASAGG